MTALSDIVHETDRHWIRRTTKGFEVYRKELTHSVRCSVIGFTGQDGLDRAMAEIRRRESEVS